MSEEMSCQSCGCSCVESSAPVEESQLHEDTHAEDTQFAVLLALVPAMTMTLFNMMGLL